MRSTKRWLAAMITIAMTLSDCGSFTVLATEDTTAAEASVSENNDKISDKFDFSGDTENTETDSKTDTASELPALHIGQIKKGEELPDFYDTDFAYDLPVSFEMSDPIVLFVNYNLNSILTEEDGTLVWNILRGKKGMTPGSTSLIDEEDDWTGFDTVLSSPYFTLKENKEKASDYYRTAELAFKDTAEPEHYDYYIRAAYYTEAGNAESESFYSAVTIPFLPKTNTDTEQTQEDVSNAEGIPADSIQDETSVSENTTADEKALNDGTGAEGNAPSETSESADMENHEDNSSPAEISSLSENHTMEESSSLSEDDTTPEAAEPVITSLTLNKTTPISLEPKDKEKIEADYTVDPADAPVTVLWESDDDTVATVNQNGLITAVSEGYAKITASCYGVTASVMVDVVANKDNPDKDKLLDLSGSIRVAGFQRESDDLVYNGQKITQNLRVYHKETLLKEKTDYTLTYKNNINAAEWNTVKAPSVTITLKGQYSGSVTLYYTIKPLDINKIDIYSTTGSKSPGYEQAVNYSKKLNIPNPVLSFGKKKLAANKDFVCDYTKSGTDDLTALPADYKNGDLYDLGKVYSYTVNGTGNFTGSFPMQLVILADKNQNFSSASIKLDKSKYLYQGTPLEKTDVKITELKIGKEILKDSFYDYEVCAYGLEGAYVKVHPSEAGVAAGYHGCKQVNLKLEGDRQIKDAKTGKNWKETILFSQKTVDKNGGIFQQEEGLLVFETEGGTKEPLTEGIDYAIKYSNAKKAGKVTVTFTGKGRYKGSLRQTYTITPNCDPKDLKIIWGENVKKDSETGEYTVSYQKGGASPALSIRDQEYTILNSKTDYSVKLSGKKVPGDDPLICTITGKGNYKGYTETVKFTVTKADISKATLSVLDKPYDAKNPNKWQSTVTVTDVNGKKLAVKTDYSQDITYSYDNMESKSTPDIGTSVTVSVQGTGCYEGMLTLKDAYRIYDKTNDISKLQIVIDNQEYSGKEVTLSSSAIHVYANAADKKAGKEIEDAASCYQIVEYKNNIKAGTAKVTLRGTGDYGGTKTYSFKILQKAYLKNSVKGITLDNKMLTLSMIELQDESSQKGVITATITSENDKAIANSTIIWTSSNNSIATVEDMEKNTIGNDSTTNATTATSTVRIRAKKEGTVTITAISQDGSKKATCKVTITNKPVFKEDGQTIKLEEIGETYPLTLQYAQTDDTAGTTASVKWESSNPNAVSVDDTGLLTMKEAGVAIITVTVSKYNFTGQCYAVAVDENDGPPQGNYYVYKQVPGTTDDTPAINQFLRDWEYNPNATYDGLYIPAGVYHIDAVSDPNRVGVFGGIVLTSNQTLIMSPSALLVAIPNNEKNSRVIYAFGRDNVTISGGQIVGERKNHKGTSGEWGHGIEISGCTNVTIENVDISQCWGDGIYLGMYKNDNLGNPTSSGITITNCNLHHNRRNNLSITDASNVTVDHCQFNYAKGTDPQFGIDIEPNIKGYTSEHITISDSTFQGNAKGTIQILGQKGANVKDVTITGCKGDKEPLVAWGYGGGGTVSGVSGAKDGENGNTWR